MTLNSFISQLKSWFFEEEVNFVNKIHSFTNNLNKLTENTQANLSLTNTFHEWLMNKDNFNYACTFLIISYAYEMNSNTIQYYNKIDLNSKSNVNFFSSWEENQIKQKAFLNAYATYFLFKLAKEGSPDLIFSEEDLKLSVDLPTGDS